MCIRDRSPTSTSPSPTKSKPSTANHTCCPPTRSDPRWPGYAANTTECSETATAPGRPSSTAHSNPSVRPARSSKPASSSAPPSKPSTTTPPTKDKPTALNSSTSCSATSTTAKHHEPLDTDHPHNAALRAVVM